jgi:hypothetical protein
MHHLMEVTKAWADKNGVTFCDDKSKVLVIGELFAANTCRSRTDRPGISWTRWKIGKEVSKEPEVPGGYDQNKLTWCDHVTRTTCMTPLP